MVMALDFFSAALGASKGDESTIPGCITRIAYLSLVIQCLEAAGKKVKAEQAELKTIRNNFENKDMTMSGEWKGKQEKKAESKRTTLVSNADGADKRIDSLIADIESAKNSAEKKKTACEEKLRKMKEELEKKLKGHG